MSITTHNVEVPFPQAFASPPKKRSPFPSAPRYGRAAPDLPDRHPTVRWECALRRGSTPSIRKACTGTSWYASVFTRRNALLRNSQALLRCQSTASLFLFNGRKAVMEKELSQRMPSLPHRANGDGFPERIFYEATSCNCWPTKRRKIHIF